jgi:hypothetical protein
MEPEAEHGKINRRFTTADARVKLKRLNPQFKSRLTAGGLLRFTHKIPKIADQEIFYRANCVEPKVRNSP